MLHSETQIAGPRSHTLYAQSWMPESEHNDTKKGIVVIAHGLAEHSGRYMNFVNHFVPLGYQVVAIDHLGHGKSEGQRCFCKSMNDFVEPLKNLIANVKKNNPQTPIFLLGHSMGGLIALHFLAKYQQHITAAILSSPAVRGVAQPNFIQKCVIGFKSLISPKDGFVQLSSAGVSRDPEVVREYENDPLVHSGKMTYGLGMTLAKAMSKLPELAKTIRLPVLVVQAGQDKLVSPQGAKDLHQWLGSEDNTLTMYPDSFHEILNEPEKDQLLSEIEKTLDRWRQESKP